jgi:hypothetical protein
VQYLAHEGDRNRSLPHGGRDALDIATAYVIDGEFRQDDSFRGDAVPAPAA